MSVVMPPTKLSIVVEYSVPFYMDMPYRKPKCCIFSRHSSSNKMYFCSNKIFCMDCIFLKKFVRSLFFIFLEYFTAYITHCLLYKAIIKPSICITLSIFEEMETSCCSSLGQLSYDIQISKYLYVVASGYGPNRNRISFDIN